MESRTYSYQFTYEFPVYDGKVAWHCSEIPFVFHNIDKVPVCNHGRETEYLQENVCNAWTSFARTGIPVVDGVEWPACTAGDEAVMMFDNICEVKHNPDHKLVRKLKKLQKNLLQENIQH